MGVAGAQRSKSKQVKARTLNIAARTAAAWILVQKVGAARVGTT